MATVTVFGHSDDLIEIEGDILEEFNYLRNDANDGALVAFSDGTILRIHLGSGPWRITPVVRGTADLAIDQADEDEDQSDTALLTGDIKWAVHGINWAKAKG